jgi:hypothetical protein
MIAARRGTNDGLAIETLLMCLSRLVEEVPHISEIDLNRVFALPGEKAVAASMHEIRIGDIGTIG